MTANAIHLVDSMCTIYRIPTSNRKKAYFCGMIVINDINLYKR